MLWHHSRSGFLGSFGSLPDVAPGESRQSLRIRQLRRTLHQVGFDRVRLLIELLHRPAPSRRIARGSRRHHSEFGTLRRELIEQFHRLSIVAIQDLMANGPQAALDLVEALATDPPSTVTTSSPASAPTSSTN